MKGILNKRICCIVCVICTLVVATKVNVADSVNANDKVESKKGFYVEGTKLFDANGNEFIIRGINHAHAWYKDKLDVSLDGIKKTGANCVRVALSKGDRWERDDKQSIKNVIEGCKKRQMVAILEVHEGTGENSSKVLDSIVDYWIENKDILCGSEKYVIINIANEWYTPILGWFWTGPYIDAVKKMRNAGFKHTLMIDAPGWGQRFAPVADNGNKILDADIYKNIIFSVHMYEYSGKNAKTIKTAIDSIQNKNLCMCIGEFGFKHTGGDVDEKFILEYCSQKNVGYAGWSWKGNTEGVEYLDISNDWEGNELSSDWGETLVNSEYGIRNTSKMCTVFE